MRDSHLRSLNKASETLESFSDSENKILVIGDGSWRPNYGYGSMVIKDVTIKTKSGAPVLPVPVSVPLPSASLWVLGSTRKVQSIDTALHCIAPYMLYGISR